MSAPSAGEQLLKDFFALRPADIRDNLRITTPGQLGQSYLVHISKDHGVERFVPNVSQRTLEDEDRRVPRISTAPTLLGAMTGYCAVLREFIYAMNQTYRRQGKPTRWNGIWSIYGLSFDVALRPSRKLVPDVDTTDEHWLVPYSASTAEYPATAAGEFFLDSLRYHHERGKQVTTIDAYLRIDHPEGMFLDQQHHLAPGCWRARIRNLGSRDSVAGRGLMGLSRISVLEYQQQQNLTLSSLSVESLRPPSADW